VTGLPAHWAAERGEAVCGLGADTYCHFWDCGYCRCDGRCPAKRSPAGDAAKREARASARAGAEAWAAVAARALASGRARAAEPYSGPRRIERKRFYLGY